MNLKYLKVLTDCLEAFASHDAEKMKLYNQELYNMEFEKYSNLIKAKASPGEIEKQARWLDELVEIGLYTVQIRK